MKRTTKSKKASKAPKSRSQKFNDLEKTDFPDFKRIADGKKIDIEKLTKKMFPTSSMKFKKVSGKNGSRVIHDSDSHDILPIESQIVGFKQMGVQGFSGVDPHIIEHFAQDYCFQGWQFNAYLATTPYISKACTMPGDDALATGFSFVPHGTKDKKLIETLEYITNDDQEFDLEGSLKKFEYNKRVFGFAIAIPCFAEGFYDAINNPNGIDMSVPLVDYGILKGKTFLGWSVIDPYWLTPEFDSDAESNPAHKNYFKPTWWTINGAKRCTVHKSWCIYAKQVMVADIVAPTYLWGGPSIPQMCYRRLFAADKCANEAEMVAMSKRLVAVTGCNTRKMAAKPDYGRKVMESFELNRDNWGMIALGAGQDIKQLDTYITEFNQLITTQYQLFCGIVEIPAPKMMMSPLTGFANSGQYEWKIYAANVKKVQHIMEIMLKATYRIFSATIGKDLTFDVKFNEIDIPTLKEQAEITYEEARAKKFNAEADAVQKMAKAKSAETHKGVVERVS